jgi:glucose-1-phosphate thymidylyltransferase
MMEEGLDLQPKPVEVWLDAGLPDTVLEANRYLLEHGGMNTAPEFNSGVKVIPPVYIHPDAKITASVIGPYASIGAGCQISYSKIENSVVEADATVETSQLRESLIGTRAKVVGARGKVDLSDDSTVEACW